MSRKELLADLISSLAVAIQRGNHRIVTRVHSMIRQAALSTSRQPLVHVPAKTTSRRPYVQPHSQIDLTNSPSPVRTAQQHTASVQSQAPSDGFGVVDENADPMQSDDQFDADTAINADGAIIGPLLLSHFVCNVLRSSDEPHADHSIDSYSIAFSEDDDSDEEDPEYVLPEDSRARDSEHSSVDGSAHHHDTRSQRLREAASGQ